MNVDAINDLLGITEGYQLHLQHDILIEHFTIRLHEDFECIRAFEEQFGALDRMLDAELSLVKKLKDVKAGFLEKMFI